MTYIEEITPHQLPEVGPFDSLDSKTASLLAHDIPAFIIRNELDPDDGPDTYSTHVANNFKVIGTIQKFHPNKIIRAHFLADYTGEHEGKLPIGVLHNDVDRLTSVVGRFEPFVHTTRRGGGRVVVAGPGSEPELIRGTKYLPNVVAETYMHKDHPHAQLLGGFTDTRLVNPHVYSGELVVGDTIVVGSGASSHSVWHRFDTDLSRGLRSVFVSLIEDHTEDRGLSPSRKSVGFDLEKRSAQVS